MTTDPREDRPPLASADQLNTAMEVLGIRRGSGPQMPRAKALGALLFMVEQLVMFDVDRVEAAEVRSGYLNQALMAGMAMRGEELPAGALIPAREFTEENFEDASFAFARLVENRLNMTLLDLEEMAAPSEPGKFNLAAPVVSWLRAICALAPTLNADVTTRDIEKAAKAAKRHAAEGRQHLADLLKLAGE